MLIPVRVHPRARRNEVIGLREGVWRVRIAAPPVDDRANRELLTFLSQALNVPKSNLSIVRGQTSRDKVIAINGLTEEEIVTRLSAFSKTPVEDDAS